MLRVALLNGTKHNYDHDLTKMIGSLINDNCVSEGLAVTSGQISAGYGFIKATRNNGDVAHILVHLTANDTTIDTSGTKKVWIELAQTHIDESGLINEDQDNVASIQTGSAFPSTAHIPLASITAGTITDARTMLALVPGVNKAGNETIGGVKTFSDFPLVPSISPTNDYEVAHKKYVDDLIAQAGAINRFEALRDLGEDLAEGDTYMIGQGGAEVDETGGTVGDMICGSSAGDLTRYASLTTDVASTVIRRVRDFEVDTQGSPTSDLSVYGVLAGGAGDVLLATTTDSSLTLNTPFTLDCDGEYLALKFVCSASSGSNYYKIKTKATSAVSQIETTQVSRIISEVDQSQWGDFTTMTIEAITTITDIEFYFQSSTSSYFAEMDWRIMKNGVTVISGPSNSSGSGTGWVKQSVTGLSLLVAPGDKLAVQMMTPNGRSTYYYRSKDFKITGDGNVLKGTLDRGYEAGKKYLAKYNNVHRNIFDGFEIDGGVEGALTEGCEGGTMTLSTIQNGSIYLGDNGGITNVANLTYIGEGRGNDVIIVKQISDEYVVVPGDTYTIATANTLESTASGTFVKIKEFSIDTAGLAGSGRVYFENRSSDNPYVSSVDVRVNGVSQAIRTTSSETFVTQFVDVPLAVGNVIEVYHMISYTSRSSQVQNVSLKYDIQNNKHFHWTATTVLN